MPARYEVAYDGGPIIHMTAYLPEGDGRLLIAEEGGIDQLPDQWATFIRNLRVTTAGGAAIPATSAGKSGWTIRANVAVELRYDVALDYAVGRWPAGNEQSGRLFPHALYSVTKPLFLYTTGVTRSAIHFSLPAGWKVAAPWKSTGANDFEAASVPSLTGNSLVLGQFPTAAVRVGQFNVTIATPGYTEVPPLLAKALAETGAMVTRVFDRTPPGRYLVTFFREDVEDGESYEDSAAMTSPFPFDSAGMVVTGNTLVHELLHYWIGGRIAPADHDSIAWFTEGFTEYYANVALARSGAVPHDLLAMKLTNHVAGYLYFMESPLFAKVTLAEAGRKKSSYRFGVYNGGWTVALSLDVMIREESKGRKSLDDAMRLLFERHGLTRQPVSSDDIRKAASDVIGRDLSGFFDKYVAKREELPVAETLAKLGLELRGQPYAADVFLIDAPSISAAQRTLRHAIFGF